MEPRTVPVHCAINRRAARPVAISARPLQRGHGALLTVEREALTAGHVFVLYRGGRTCKVIAASMHRERVEAVRGRLTKRTDSYAIAQVPVVQSW
jgi:hypothetical protein